MYQQLMDLLMPPLRPDQIPEAYYGAHLKNGAGLIYYFNINMVEIGYTGVLNTIINRNTAGRKWDPKLLKKYHIYRTWWTED